MMTFSKILLPVDGSKSSRLAKQNATALAAAMEAEILLVYITGTIPSLIIGKPREEAIKAQHEEADVILTPYRQYLKEHNVRFSEKVTSALNAGDEICRIASEEQCDLIVMGSRGLNDFEGLLVGSVTHRVLNRCSLPVLIVR